MRHILKNRKGQNATEYIIILAILVAVLVAAMPSIKSALQNKFQQTGSKISSAN